VGGIVVANPFLVIEIFQKVLCSLLTSVLVNVCIKWSSCNI